MLVQYNLNFIAKINENSLKSSVKFVSAQITKDYKSHLARQTSARQTVVPAADHGDIIFYFRSFDSLFLKCRI